MAFVPLPSQTPDSLASLRWLASHCGVVAPSAPAPCLASQMMRDPEFAKVILPYLILWMRHPDKGSTFESAASALAGFSDEDAVRWLAQRGYDGLIFVFGGEIVGHLFFQRHPGEICVFSLAATDRCRSRKWWVVFGLDFIAYAAGIPGIQRMSVGTGKNPVGRLFIRLVRRHASSLGWKATDDGWIDFGDRSDAPPG